MTQEEKAKRYDEVIKKAKEYYEEGKTLGKTLEYVDDLVSDIFPELKESEDERIRKTLIDYFNTCHGDYYGELKRKDILAWLEKQGKQKPTDKLEPKFHEGEWIVWKDKCYKVNYNGCGYELVDQDGLSTSLEYGTVDESAHLWDVTKDANDGDVLACNDNPFLFLKYEKDEYGLVCCSYCGISDSEYGEFAVNTNTKKYWCDIEFVNPANKEQRDLLFQKMHEAGYEWDSEKKELKEIEQKPTDEEMKELLRTEYEKGRADAIAEMQNLAWSEEDEEFLRRAINVTKDAYPMTAKWLKSLRTQNRWKPSDEQIKALHDLNLTGNISYAGQGQVLIELYNDLKRLLKI